MDKKLIGARVTEDRRKRWSRYVEESREYDTMAQLIRTSVERTIQKDSDEIERKIEILQDDIAHVIDQIQYTRQDIENLDESIDRAEEIAEETVYRINENGED